MKSLFGARRQRFLRNFDVIDDVGLVGGKGQSLQQLRSIGAPVPEGFILTTHFCAELEAHSRSLSAQCRATLERIRVSLGPGPLIVRSSAVGEDGHAAAFAGLLESIFPVDATNPAAVEAAVRTCIASRHAPRVLAYEKARQVRLEGMAVVVQRLVPCKAAGVLFTEGVTLYGEWCQGQGQKLVDGQISPGAFRLDRRAGKPAHVERSPEDGSDFPLSDQASATLVRYATNLERRRGVSLDIEWAVDEGGDVWFVQARPVTHRKTYLYSNANISENFPTPVVPLLDSFARAGYEAYFRNLAREFGISEARIAAEDDAFRQIIAVHGARLYYNLSHIHSVLRLMPFGDLLVDSFDTFVGAGESQARGNPIYEEVFAVAGVVGHVLRAYRDLPTRIERFERTVNEVATRFHPRHLDAMSNDELAQGLRAIHEIRVRRWIDASLADCAAAMTYRALQALLRSQHREDPARHHTLLEGLDVAGAWSLRALWELARALSADAGACEALEKALEKQSEGFESFYGAVEKNLRLQVEDWLDQYGFRGSGELLLTEPSLAEEPDRLLPLLHRYVQAALDRDDTSPAMAFDKQKKAREKMTERYRVAFFPAIRPIFDKLLEATQASVKFRERARFRQALLYSRLRSVALACGRRLVCAGTITTIEDVFFFSFDELSSLMVNAWTGTSTPHELVLARRTSHAVQSTLDMPDVFTLVSGHTASERDFPVDRAEERQPEQDGVLVGVPASAGVVQGRAAVLEGIADANRLQRGDVLVARQTDPGWAPLFFLVKGLVLERGGMLSHGSILARELGIPSVVGVERATSRIQHGSSIVVNGDAGHVSCV
jgi:rifampicin phosphotransferase